MSKSNSPPRPTSPTSSTSSTSSTSPTSKPKASDAYLARKALQASYALAAQRSATSALAYLQHVLINKATGPQLFREVAEPWQWQLAARIVPALESVAGLRTDYTGPRNFWLTLPRGHDKTSLIGRLCSWLLAFARKPTRIAAGAADKDQAGLIAEFMQIEARLNPWLFERLDFRNWLITGRETDSRLRILSADDKGTFGLSEDVIVLDELTHWPKQGLFDTLVTGIEKRAGQAVTIVITNAGVLRTWQHDVFLGANRSPAWYVYEAPHHLASWMSLDRINDLRKLVPAPLAKRVFDNQWIDPSEDCGFCTAAEAQRTVRPHLTFRDKGSKAHRPYYAGIDYGPVRDRTALSIVHFDDDTRDIVLDHLTVLEGKNFAGGRVPIAIIEQWMENVEKDFFHPTFVIDPYNLESTLQKYEGSFEVVRFEPRAGKANYALASNLRSLIVNDHLAIYPNAGEVLVNHRFHSLVDELAEITIETKSYGYRISHDGHGHDDRVVSVGMAALEAVRAHDAIAIPTSGRWF